MNQDRKSEALKLFGERCKKEFDEGKPFDIVGIYLCTVLLNRHIFEIFYVTHDIWYILFTKYILLLDFGLAKRKGTDTVC